VLLVVAPEPAEAAWARASIPLGHPGFCLAPLVIGFDDLPRITDPVLARRLPELAVLSTLAHPELEVATTAVGAISLLPEDQSRLYLDVVMTALSPLIRQALEARMQGYEYQSEFARRYYNEGRNEGREEGREEGLQRAVLSLARAKLDSVTVEDDAAIRAIRDEDVLEALISALGSVSNAVEARAALDRTIARHAAISSSRRSAEVSGQVEGE
jgi:hypothetical protein